MNIKFKQPTPEKRAPKAGEIWRHSKSKIELGYLVVIPDLDEQKITHLNGDSSDWTRSDSRFTDYFEFYAEGLEITE